MAAPLDELLEVGMVRALNQMYGTIVVDLAENMKDVPEEVGVKPLDVETTFRNLYRRVTKESGIDEQKQRDNEKKALKAAEYENREGNGTTINIYVMSLDGRRISLTLSADDFVETLKEKILKERGRPADDILMFRGKTMVNGNRLRQYGITDECTVHMYQRFRGGGCAHYYLDPGSYDPQWNYDFRSIKVDTEVFRRNSYVYTRPLGSMRYAVKVLGKYENNRWLGSSGVRFTGESDEWPVAYHGTLEKNAEGIVVDGFKLSKGVRFLFGKGIYCTPNPRVALDYAIPYTFKGKNYRLIIQTRVNPAQLKIVKTDKAAPHDEYWLVPNEDHIRPYGVCIFDG